MEVYLRVKYLTGILESPRKPAVIFGGKLYARD
jgi:hypothetical protein